MKKVAVITGGGGGIGRAVAIALSDEGWHVVVAGRTKVSLDETVALFKTEGLAVACDVSTEADVSSLFEQTVAKFGQVDMILITLELQHLLCLSTNWRMIFGTR